MSSITAATVWTVAGTSLVALMLLGYALFDVGSVQHKNTSGTIVRHVVVTFASVLGFLFIGFGLFFGGRGGFFGVLDFFTLGNYGPELPEGVPLTLFVAAQAVVCAVCANIVCGTLAERSNIAANVAAALVVSLLVYPFVNRWTWGQGWLAQMGFHDFAGSASLNVVAGVVALVAAALMGPRSGKYVDGEVRALPGQSLTRCLEGSLLIFVGWFGLMGVSCLAFGVSSVDAFGQAVLGMLAASSVSALTAMVATKARYGGVDVPMALNGLVGGLVAVSSGADVMSPLFCAFAGVAAGLVVVFGTERVERCSKVDDPVGSIVTHGACGVLGLVLAGIFGESGLIFGGFGTFVAELVGLVAIAAWAAVFSWIVFSIVKRNADLRVLDSEETAGLGLSGPSLNNAFMEYLPELSPAALQDASARTPDLPIDAAVPLALMGGADSCTLKKVEVICRPTRLDGLREELNRIGVTGMTVSDVRGCGEQKGARETYRGIPVSVEFVPKVQVDIVVSKVPVEDVVFAARRALYTGHIGDGKVFVYGVAEAVKVRTGEHGFDAVQSIDVL